VADQTDLFVEFLDARTNPKGVVLVVHGYAEHSGRYRELAGEFLTAGFSTLLYDHRGFGQSPGRPGYVDRIGRLVEDLHGVVALARERWPGLPLFLFGHSMGGLIATLYCLDHAEGGIDGLILSSPLLQTQESPILQRLATVLGTLAPHLPTVKMDRSAISRDAAVISEAESDPLNYHGKLPARTGAEFVRGMRRAEAEAHRLDLPLLLVHGTADRLTDPEGSRDLYARVSSNHKQLSLFEGSYHETFHDLDRSRVVEGVVDWLVDSTA
jgi:alpha-beta hydrolase superfamily lysophospholipase